MFFVLVPTIVLDLLSYSPGGPTRRGGDTVSAVPAVIVRVRGYAHLCATRTRIRGVVARSSRFGLGNSFLGRRFGVPIPNSGQGMTVPVSTAVGTCMSFRKFSSEGISQGNSGVRVVLPSPGVILADAQVSRGGLGRCISLAHDGCSSTRLARLRRRNERDVVHSVPGLSLVRRTHIDTTGALVPVFGRVNFQRRGVRVDFHGGFALSSVEKFLRGSKIRGGSGG